MLFTILKQLIPFLFIALVVLALKSWLRSAKGKGQLGEFIVARMLAQLGPGYEILNDLTFVVDGDSTQIDHVVVSTKGVFLIETKNYSGLIFGQANEGQWTQAVGHTKNRFQNPLRQNFKHVKFLSQKLDVKESAIVPMVVFLGGANFPNGKPEGVYSPRELVKAIGSAVDARLNNAQTFTIRRRLEELGATTAEKTARHLANLTPSTEVITQDDPLDELASVGLPPGLLSHIKLPSLRRLLRWPLLFLLVASAVLWVVLSVAADSGTNQGLSPFLVFPAAANLGAAIPFFFRTEPWALRLARWIIVAQGALVFLMVMILTSAAISLGSMSNSKDPDMVMSWIVGGGLGGLFALLGLLTDAPQGKTATLPDQLPPA